MDRGLSNRGTMDTHDSAKGHEEAVEGVVYPEED